LNFNRNSQEILGTLEFDEIWLTSSLLHLIARKNKFPARVGQKFEFPMEKGIWIAFAIVCNLDLIFGLRLL
jgi:hypothetical protein